MRKPILLSYKVNKIMNSLQNNENLTILAIESSCDETAAAVVRNGREILSNIVATQIDIHRRFGGVVPEIASRNHVMAIEEVVKEAIEKSGIDKKDIDAIAVTYGAGLLGALLVGLSYAKGLSLGLNKPLFGVSHIMGHIAANYLSSDLQPPYLCLMVSGGHTALLDVESYGKIKLLCSTGDDAAGEAFDKAARLLGLSYPGGVEIERLAKDGKPSISFPVPDFKKGFSFSGLKTAVVNYIHNKKQKGEEINGAVVACSFQEAVVKQLFRAVEYYLKKTGRKKVAIAGGVGANSRLREELDTLKEQGITVYYPPVKLCTDNAAMIASAAYFMIKDGAEPSNLALDAKATVPLGF